MDLNDNGISVSTEVRKPMQRHASKQADGKPFKTGMVFPAFTHNYEPGY